MKFKSLSKISLPVCILVNGHIFLTDVISISNVYVSNLRKIRCWFLNFVNFRKDSVFEQTFVVCIVRGS